MHFTMKNVTSIIIIKVTVALQKTTFIKLSSLGIIINLNNLKQKINFL